MLTGLFTPYFGIMMDNTRIYRQTNVVTYRMVSKRGVKIWWSQPKALDMPKDATVGFTAPQCSAYADYSISCRGLLHHKPMSFVCLYFFPFFDYVFPYLPPFHLLSARHLRSSSMLRSDDG